MPTGCSGWRGKSGPSARSGPVHQENGKARPPIARLPNFKKSRREKRLIISVKILPDKKLQIKAKRSEVD
jgi:hypothetical protein